MKTVLFVRRFQKNLVGSNHFSEVRLEGEFRPLGEVEQRHRRQPKEAENALPDAPVEQAHDIEEQGQETLQQLSLLHEEGLEEETNS